MRKNSIKNTKINAQVHREISNIVRSEIKDPRIHPMTSITDALVTSDLKYCTVYVSVLGDEENGNETLKGLQNAAGFIRKELAARLNLRNTPELRFVLDRSLAYGMKMSKLIDEVISKDERDKGEES